MTLAAPLPFIRCNFARKRPFEDLVVSYAPTGGYWRFNEAAGSILFDRLNGNHGTYAGGFTLGQTGLLFEDTSTDAKFNGTTGYASVPDANSLDVGDVFTVGGVIKLAALGVKQYLAVKGTGAFAVYVDTDNKLKLEKLGTGLICLSTITLDLNAHFWMIVKSGASVAIYIDDTDVTGAITNQTCANTATALFIGQNGSGASFSGATFGELFLDSTAWSSTRASLLYVAFAMGEFGASLDSIAAKRVLSGTRRRGLNVERSNTQVGLLDLNVANKDGFLTARRNHVPNPSMEFGLHDLNITALASIGAAATSLAWRKDPATGGGIYCGEVSLSATINSMVWFAIEGTWPAGQAVTIGGKIKSQSGNTNVEIGIVSLGTPSDIAHSGGTIAGAYGAPVSATLTPAADRNDLVGFIRTTSAAAAVARFDELQVNGGAALITYIEGPTWPMLQDALPVHCYTSYLGTDYPWFFGYAELTTPTPENLRVDLQVNDPLKNLNQSVDLTITGGGCHYTLRYGLIDAAIRRVQQTAGGAENLCINGGAEADVSGWLASPSWTRSTATSHSGAACFKLAGPQGAGYMMPPFLQAQLVVGRLYQLSLWARIVSAADSLTVQFGDIFLQPAGFLSLVTGTNGAAALTTTFQRFVIPWFNTGTVNAGSIQFLSGTGDPTNGIYIDDVMVSEGFVLPSGYVDFASPTGRLRNYAAAWQSTEAIPIFSQGWGNRCTNPEAVTDTTGWTTLAGPSFYGSLGAGPLDSGWFDNDSQTYSTTNEVWQNNVGYLIDVVNSHATSAGTVTVTGGGLTWVSMGTSQFSGTTRRVTRFRALVTAGATTAQLTITVAGTANTGCGYELFAFAGVPTGGANGANAFGTAVVATGSSNAPTVTAGAAASPGHMMLATVCADSNVTVAAAAPYGGLTRKSGAAPAGSIQSQWCDLPALKAAATLSASAAWAMVTCEVKGKAGGAIARVVTNNPDGTRLANSFGTGLTLTGGLGNAAIFTTSGTCRANHAYTFSCWASEISGSASSTYKVAAVSPAGGDVVQTVVTGPLTSPGARIWITFVPTADRTDVSFVIRSSASNTAAPGNITFTGVMINPGGLFAYARTGVTAPNTLDEVNTLTSGTLGIQSHSHCTQFTTYATAGSGVALMGTTLQPVAGKTMTLLVTATASAGTPSIAFGVANPWGTSAPDVGTATYVLSTTPQRFYVKFTPARTDFTTFTGQVFGSYLMAYAMVTSAAAVTIALDDVSLTMGTTVQAFIPPEAAGVDTAEIDLLPPYAASAVNAIDTLDGLNVANLGGHTITYLRNRPYFKYTSFARKALATKATTRTWSEVAAAVANLQADRSTTFQVAIAQYNPNSITPLTGVVVPTHVGVAVQASATILARVSGAPTPITVGDTQLTNGPAGGCTDAADIAAYQIARFGTARMRPEFTFTNDWPTILGTAPFDIAAWTFARNAVYGLPLLVLSSEDTIGPGAAKWDSKFDNEELVRA